VTVTFGAPSHRSRTFRFDLKRGYQPALALS